MTSTTPLSTVETIYNGTTCLKYGSGLTITASSIIFDAQNDTNAVFIIISNSLTINVGFSTVLTNGANASNIFWVDTTFFSFSTSSIHLDGNYFVRNFTVSSSTVYINGSLYSKYPSLSTGSNLTINSISALYGDIPWTAEIPVEISSSCVYSNGTCVDEGNSTISCVDEGTSFYYNQTCAEYIAPVFISSSCVYLNGTCVDERNDTISCIEEGTTFYYNQTCAEYISTPLDSACVYSNGSCVDERNDTIICIESGTTLYYNYTCAAYYISVTVQPLNALSIYLVTGIGFAVIVFIGYLGLRWLNPFTTRSNPQVPIPYNRLPEIKRPRA